MRLHHQRRRARDHGCSTGGAAERSLPVTRADLGRQRGPGCSDLGFDALGADARPARRTCRPCCRPAGSAALALIETLTVSTGSQPGLDCSSPSDCWITSDGTKLVPPPYEKVTASPGATSAIRTPIAPALAAASTFRLTEHVPRSIRAILPASEPAGSGAQARLLVPPACSAVLMSPEVSLLPTGANASVSVLL